MSQRQSEQALINKRAISSRITNDYVEASSAQERDTHRDHLAAHLAT